MGPYGSVGAHIKTGRSPVAQDHFKIPPDPKMAYKNLKITPKRGLRNWRRPCSKCVPGAPSPFIYLPGDPKVQQKNGTYEMYVKKQIRMKFTICTKEKHYVSYVLKKSTTYHMYQKKYYVSICTKKRYYV